MSSDVRLSRVRAPRSGTVTLFVGLCAILTMVPSVRAGHMQDWTHDHSLIPVRPGGYGGLVQRFGQPCSSAADDARSYWPHQSARNVGGYIRYHSYVGENIGFNVRTHINAAHRDGATDYGVYGYNCRMIAGSTSWSTHAFGAAVDTNSFRNPQFQTSWNGVGADGTNRFYWGLNFSSGRQDPMHFQFVTGY
jgi:D-alanyl-D-alanine carboxypeptidase